MKLLSIIISMFILAIIIMNTTIFIKSTSVSTLNNLERDRINKIVKKRTTEILQSPFKKDVIDTINVGYKTFFLEHKIEITKIKTIVKDHKNKILYVLYN